MNKKVLVVGFFDMFHSGHVEFLKIASTYGDVYVSVATDENSFVNKNKYPIYSEEERLFMVKSCKYISDAEISYGRKDILSFEPQLNSFSPDIFIINEDGHSKEKQKLCKSRGIEYIVLPRLPHKNLPSRSTTKLSSINHLPLRIDFVSFLDQKILNKLCPSSVLIANIEPIPHVFPRSGMCNSTLTTIRKLFGNYLPENVNKEELAKTIFFMENYKSEYISGAIDQIGITHKSILRLEFYDSYWPSSIHQISTNVQWLNKYLYIVHLRERPDDFIWYNKNININDDLILKQSMFVSTCLYQLRHKDIKGFGETITNVHKNQKQIFPNYESKYSEPIINHLQTEHYGCKLLGAGGDGYALVITDKPEENFIKIEITQ